MFELEGLTYADAWLGVFVLDIVVVLGSIWFGRIIWDVLVVRA